MLKFKVLKFRGSCERGEARIILNGGFGNQLFQLATATEYAVTNALKVTLNFNPGTRNFALESLGLKLNQSYKPIVREGILFYEEEASCKKCVFSKYEEQDFVYNPIPKDFAHIQMSGYFQSPRYFDFISDALKKFLSVKLNLKKRDEEMLLVHARLGDMATNPTSRAFHGLISDDYVLDALKILDAENATLKVVTESKETLFAELPRLASRADFIQTSTMEDDFRTLCEAKKLVISNSTFSWWAAWISGAEVVAPRAWFTPEVLKKNPTRDLFPPQWNVI